jgi:YidC/Oxa1 family membrane protein insertase
MFLFFTITLLAFLVTQYFFKPAPALKSTAPTITAKNAGALAAKPADSTAGAPTAEVAGDLTPTSGQAETLTTIDTDVFHVVTTNKGGLVKSWVLKKYKDSNGKPLDVVNTAANGLPGPFSIDLKDQKTSIADPNSMLYVATSAADKLGITFEYSDGKTSIRKSIQCGKSSYLCDVRSEVVSNGSAIPHLLMWRGGFGDETVRNASSTQHSVHFDTASGKLVKKNPKDAKDGPLTEYGNFTFAGLEDNFFAAVALPSGNSANVELRTYDDVLVPKEGEKAEPFVGSGVGTGAQNQFSLFVGPKDIDLLRKVSPKLEQLVDWGFFGVIARPLFLWLNWVNDHWTGNFGWAIIVVTAIINILLLPFKLTSLRSARKMQKIAPQVKAINDKYKGIGMRDPKAAEKNQEVMALYKEHGVNPVGGCLPLLIQLPFFYAFYRVLSIATELRGASWLWVTDLSRAETLAIHLLPIILVATQFLMQKMTPAAGVDPQQQKMMQFMPLMFGFMFYTAPAGLVLYWLTGNVVGVLQQMVINRFMPLPTPAAAELTAKASGSKAPVKAPVNRSGKK